MCEKRKRKAVYSNSGQPVVGKINFRQEISPYLLYLVKDRWLHSNYLLSLCFQDQVNLGCLDMDQKSLTCYESTLLFTSLTIDGGTRNTSLFLTVLFFTKERGALISFLNTVYYSMREKIRLSKIRLSLLVQEH